MTGFELWMAPKLALKFVNFLSLVFWAHFGAQNASIIVFLKNRLLNRIYNNILNQYWYAICTHLLFFATFFEVNVHKWNESTTILHPNDNAYCKCMLICVCAPPFCPITLLTYVVQERINDAANGDRPSRRFKWFMRAPHSLPARICTLLVVVVGRTCSLCESVWYCMVGRLTLVSRRQPTTTTVTLIDCYMLGY